MPPIDPEVAAALSMRASRASARAENANTQAALHWVAARARGRSLTPAAVMAMVGE